MRELMQEKNGIITHGAYSMLEDHTLPNVQVINADIFVSC